MNFLARRREILIILYQYPEGYLEDYCFFKRIPNIIIRIENIFARYLLEGSKGNIKFSIEKLALSNFRKRPQNSISKVSKTLSSSGFHFHILSKTLLLLQKRAQNATVFPGTVRSEFRFPKGIESVEEDDASSNTVIAAWSPTSVWSAHAPPEPTCLCKNRISRRRVKRRPWTNRVLSPSKRRCPFSFATARLP